MRTLDILGFILPVLGAYGIVFSVRFFLPCNTIRHVSAALNQVELLVNRFEAINGIPNASEYRTNLAMCEDPCSHRRQCTDRQFCRSLANQLSRFRTENQGSPGFFSQLRLVLQSGLTCRLYVLSSRIEAMRLKVEVRRTILLTLFTT